MLTVNAQTFQKTLQSIEQSKDPTALVDLFGDGATIDSPAREGKLTGRESIRHFWQEYLDAFRHVRSTFTVDHTIGDTGVLQWVSEGMLTNGKPVRYRGVSIVTFKGYKVASFTTYYDSAVFVTHAPDAKSEPSHAGAAVIPGPDTNNEGGD